jgi:hypothetical protein
VNESPWTPPVADLESFGRKALGVGLLALAACAAGWYITPDRFLRGWLVGWVFVLGVALGAHGIYLVHLLSRGAWGLVIRRVLEAAAGTLPLMALFSLPVLFGMKALYPWADATRVAGDEILSHRSPWMSPAFAVARLVLYFLLRLSTRQDTSAEPAAIERRMQALAGPGLVLHILAVSFFSFDFLMSLNAHWYSTIYGFYVVGGQAVSGLSFAILVELLLSAKAPFSGVLKKHHVHDHGKLLLAFMMLWGYFAISQYLIIWSGDLPEETVFFKDRFAGGWGAVALALVFLHFVLPFSLLLSRDLKRDVRKLSIVAALLLVMRWVDFWWLAAPAFSPRRLSFHWLDVAAPVAMGSLFLYAFAKRLARRPLLPVHDPHLEAAIAVPEGHHV